ncbi:MAG: FMN-binding protein [Phycisphaerae bacterium]|nr:FMN-binding protein [Phycisphaerae bacterium]
MLKYIKQGWLVIVLAACFGTALAGIHMALKDKIAANQLDAINTQIPLLIPGADAAKTQLDEPLTKQLGMEVRKGINSEGKLVGWVLRASGSGYADKIELLIGLDKTATKIMGIAVIEQQETPCLGSKITDSSWNDQYDDQPTATELVVLKGMSPEQKLIKDGKINAITGATISSDAVTSIVNDAVTKAKPALLAELKKDK